VAALIDWAIYVGIFIVGGIFLRIVPILGFVGYLAALAYAIYNFGYLQGTTGQTIGKKQQGIKLVMEETGQPVGFGMAVVRWLVAGVLGGVTCGIYGLLDILFPLWDAKRQRITDKILKMGVVKA
jgi:uncharacterized RDD family membrane protein YckC